MHMKRRNNLSLALELLESRQLLSGDFTVVAMSDTQYTVESYPQIFNAQTQWAADHATDPAWNVAFLAHQGDMLRRGYSSYQAANASAALNTLNGKVPYLADIGNHDFDNQFDDLDHHISSANFTANFGDARYQPLYGSNYGSSLDQRNKYDIITQGNQQYMVLSMEWEAEDSAIAWAQGVINAHRQLPIILTTHEYLNGSGRTTSPLDPLGNSGENIYQKLVKPNPQIFLVLSGHTGTILHQTSLNNAGTQIFETTQDFEGRPHGGDGYMQLFHFDPANNIINVSTYSPSLGLFDTSSASQFSLPINFASRFAFATAAPVANDDTFAVTPDVPSFAGNALSNDYNATGAPLTASLVAAPTHGVLALNPDGSFTYTPNSGYHGLDSFTYTTTDGAKTSNLAKVTFQMNNAPVALADSAATPEGKAITIAALANDTDPDANTLSSLLVSLPANGAVFANANGTFTYTPDPKFIGTDSFTYKANDGTALSAPVTVNITVRPAAPIYDYPISETTTTGTRSGSYTNLQSSDGVEETITEASVSNSAKLDHRWQFNVTGGTDVTVGIKAKRSLGTDEYHLQYSTNGSTFSDLTQIVPASSKDVTRILYDADEPYQLWQLPAATKGTVYIRMTDTKSNSDICSLTVDELFIRSGVSFPSVSIAAIANASEANAAPATFAVTRTGPTATPLTVNFSLSGSATAGTDYTAPSGTLTIPAGANSASFSITPITDGNVEGSETLIATLAPDNAYDLATPTATATLSDLGPTNLSASANTDPKSPQITLAWTDNNTDETGFNLQRSTDGVNFTTLATLPADTTTYTDVSLPQNTTYTYRISAISDTASTPFSNTASATTPTDADITPPSSPQNLHTTSITTNSIALAWNASTDNVGVTGYDLYRNGALSASGLTSTTFTDTNLSSNTTYTYSVIARDAAANSSTASTPVSATTLAAVPTAPTSLTGSYTKSNRKATLKWQDHSTNETGFHVWYSTNNGATWSIYATLSANATSYTTSALTRNLTYLFKISASNAAGDSLFSNQISILAS
jgi:fibronectin type 3 domain-containing protein